VKCTDFKSVTNRFETCIYKYTLCNNTHAGVGKVVFLAALLSGKTFSRYYGLELSGMRNEEVSCMFVCHLRMCAIFDSTQKCCISVVLLL